MIRHVILVLQKAIYCLKFLQNDKIRKRSLCFIPEVTCSVLSVGVCQFSLRENVCSVRAALFVGHRNSYEGGWVFAKDQLRLQFCPLGPQNIIFCHKYLPYNLVFTKESK